MATTNIVTLAQVKQYLRFSTPTAPSNEDQTIQWFISAADQVVQFECGDILPHSYSEHYDGGDYEIHLRNVPLLTVENVEEGWGWINYELDYQEVNSPASVFKLFAYSIDSHENAVISRRSSGNVTIPFRPGNSNIFVQYTTGEQSVPANIFLAELELVAHWWRNSQLRAAAMAGANVAYDAVAGQVYTRDTESGSQNLNIGVPYAILEELKSHRHRPFIA